MRYQSRIMRTTKRLFNNRSVIPVIIQKKNAEEKLYAYKLKLKVQLLKYKNTLKDDFDDSTAGVEAKCKLDSIADKILSDVNRKMIHAPRLESMMTQNIITQFQVRYNTVYTDYKHKQVIDYCIDEISDLRTQNTILRELLNKFIHFE